jgi:hypothetical protein
MLKRIPWWVKALIIAAALLWAATYNQPRATPAAPATPPALAAHSTMFEDNSHVRPATGS